MPRSKLLKQSGGGGTCPPNKFSLLSGCASWSAMLAVIALVAVLGIALMVTLNRKNMLINGKGVMMVRNNLSATAPNKNKLSENYDNVIITRENERFQPRDTNDDGHDGTGTATSERIQYDINVNIRDVDSYRQNPNEISIGRYEAQKNMERIINPLLPPERSYVNTYGVPINIPSRGPFQAYQQVGILTKENIVDPDKLPGNNNESNILPLFGRPTYTGSNRWNYYTSSDKFQSVKLPINIDGRKCTDDLGCNELMDGDMVTIPSYNGRFKVEIYDFDKPRYIPYAY